MPVTRLTRLELNSQCMGQASNKTMGNTLLIRTVSVIVTVSGRPTFSIPNLAFLTPLIMRRTSADLE